MDTWAQKGKSKDRVQLQKRANKGRNFDNLLVCLFVLMIIMDPPLLLPHFPPPQKKDPPQYLVAPNTYPERYPDLPYQAWMHRLESDSSRLFPTW